MAKTTARRFRYRARNGLPNATQTCTDGDPVCDKDGSANGQCVFAVTVCLNVSDGRLVNRDGSAACVPSAITQWTLRNPRLTSRKPVEAANAQALRDTVRALGSSTLSGRSQDIVQFSPALNAQDACAQPVNLTVPLNGVAHTRKATARLTMASTTPPVGSQRAVSDRDTLSLVCKPPQQ